MLIVFDCESFLFKSAVACKTLRQSKEDPYIYQECYDLRQGIDFFNKTIDSLKSRLASNDIVMVVGDNNNWRKEYYPDYKANRNKEKDPTMVPIIKKYIYDNYDVVSLPNLEADDTCRIINEDDTNYPTRKVLVSIDKDFKTFPCELYNPDKDTLQVINKDEAEYNLKLQVLMGDKSDNYPGVKGYGLKTSVNFLDKDSSWDAIKELMGKQDYLINRNMAEIIGLNRYDFESGKVKIIYD